MKIVTIILILFVISCASTSCNRKTDDEVENPNNNYFIDDVSDREDSADIEHKNGDSENMQVNKSNKVNEMNRSIIAEALGMEENNRKLRFILSSLNTIQTGQLQSAKMLEIDGESVLYIVAEDSTDYQIYLSGSGSVEAVKNLITEEWVIRTKR